MRLIGFAVKHGWPLPPLLDAKAEDECGTQRRKISSIDAAVAGGDQLARRPGTLARHRVTADRALRVRLGMAAGLLPDMLRRCRRRTLDHAQPPATAVDLVVPERSLAGNRVDMVFFGRQVPADVSTTCRRFQDPSAVRQQWVTAIAARAGHVLALC